MCIPTPRPLFPHQKVGARFLTLQPIRILADEQGVGKTAQVIAAARRLGLRRVLIVCPKSARHIWMDEWPLFYPEDPSPMTEMHKIRDELPDDGHVVCTFEFARRRHADLFIWGMWDCIVIDEFHELRGTDAGRTYAIMHPQEGLVRRTKRFWALTGTPIANNLVELYPILRIAGVYTGSLDSFVRRFCQTYYDRERGELKIVGANERNLPDLHKLLDDSGIMLRRLKKEVMPDLPKMTYEHVQVKKGEVDLEELFPDWAMSEKMVELVQMVENQRGTAWAALRPEGAVDRMPFHQGVELLKGLSESISELLKLVGMQKVGAVIELVKEELSAGLYPKIFLITRHTMVSETLMHGLREFNPVRIIGATSGPQRKKAIERFSNDDSCRVFIGQVKACGPAVNLTARGLCWEIGVVEQSPVPGENNQALARPHRTGCTHPVRARIFQLDDPIDKRWEELVFHKNLHIAKTMREGLFLAEEFDPIG